MILYSEGSSNKNIIAKLKLRIFRMNFPVRVILIDLLFLIIRIFMHSTTSKFKSLLLAKYIVIHIRRRPITLDLNAFLKVYLLLKKGSISHLSEFYLSAHSANNFRNMSVPSGYTVVLMAQRFKRLSVNFTSLFVYWNQE